MEHTTVIVLAAGQGKRMNTKVHKQYLLIKDKPVLFYTLDCLEKSFIDDIVLVVGEGEQEYCQKEIIEKYNPLSPKADKRETIRWRIKDAERKIKKTIQAHKENR